MAKVRDKAGKEVEGQKMVTERQTEHFAKFLAVRSTVARRQRALNREDMRNLRSHIDQLLLLDQRLGKGVGAKKERERLTQIIAEQNA